MKRFLMFYLAVLVGAPPAAAADTALGEFGTIRLLIFEAGRSVPLPDVTVRVGPVRIGETNDDGALTISLYEGLYHFSLDAGDGVPREVAMRVLPGQVVEAIAEVAPGAEEVLLTLEQGKQVEAAAAAPGAALPLSSITGRVVNEETGAGVADARIFVRGLTAEARTDEAGRFEVAVPIGTHDLVVVHSEFGTVTKAGVVVGEGTPAAVTVETVPVGVELDELVVTAPRIEGSQISILKERQETSQVSDVIGAEQMSKTGDADAAAALKRVTGVTIVGGKYVYVRGLGERYSSTLLNRLNLPSPDPERRVVPLDLFPAAMLDSMVIQKSFSPDMPGEFGGGVVDLRTKGYPSELVLKLSVSGGITTGTTFHERPVAADAGPTDFLGIDGGHRALAESVEKATEDAPLETGSRFTSGFSKEELAALTRDMKKSWGIAERTVPPDLTLSLTAGNGFALGRARLGFLASLLYKNEWDASETQIRDYKIADGETGALMVRNRYTFDETANIITLGGIFAAGLDLADGHRVKANTIVNRITDDIFWTYQGKSFDLDADIRGYNYEWIERMIFTQQVIGEHLLAPDIGLKLDWRYAFSNARRNEPDVRAILYGYRESADDWMASNRPDGNKRDYLFVNDNAHDLGLDLTLPFVQWSEEKGLVKAGGAILLKRRDVDIRRFQITGIDNVDVADRMRLPEDFFVDELMSVDGMILEEATQNTDNYTGEQSVFAGYLLAELPLGAGLKASGGVRLEKSEQRVSTFSIFSASDPVEERIDELDVLPAANLVYDFGNDMLLRAGYGKTLNRPDFSEMSPGCASSYAGGYSLCGAWRSQDFDNALARAVIHNVDLRWEWYPAKGESLSFGAFFKAFVDPLESVVKAGSDKVKFIMNAVSARNFGLELDFRKNLEFIHDAVRDVYVAGNATWVRSEVEIPDIPSVALTNTERALQGQSPYIVNLQVGYDNVDIGTSAVILYNVFGKRISDVGANGMPDVYEQPFHKLDLILKQKIRDHFEVGFKAQNLLDWPVAFLQGGEPTRRYKKGRSFSLSLTIDY